MSRGAPGGGALGRGIWPLADAASMRALDRHTIETLGVPGEILMESAGRALAEVVLSWLPSGGRVLLVCGAGNNGGDGLVAARHLHAVGVPVRAALLGDPEALRGDAAAMFRRARQAGVALEGPAWQAPERGVIVDAIFGTGLSRPVEGAAAAAIRRIRKSREGAAPGLRVVAVDLPSGLCADTGQVLGEAVAADATLAISLPKPGLALEPGRHLAGQIAVARIGIADEAPGVALSAELWTRPAAGAQLPARPAAAHKGSFGHVLIAAGSEGKSGAAALAAAGAARMGAGLVTVACPAGLGEVLEIKCTEAMTAPLPDTPERGFAASAEEPLLRLAEARDAVGLGPGLGEAADTVKWVRAVVPRIGRPLALDADGLNALVGQTGLLAGRRAPTVLTPHPGEAARLLETTAAAVNADRLDAARRLARRCGAVVLLKGAASVCADPEGRAVVNPSGGPALASGGTGDVLLGAVTALLAQGLPALEAAALAAFVHGEAADRIAAQSGPSGLLAGDLADTLPAASRALRQAADHGPRLADALRLPSPSPEHTRAAARALGRCLDERGLVVALVGPLGAGKTLFAKGLAEGLGVDPDAVASPTFVIASEYPGAGRRLAHADFYRLETRGELEATGFADLLGPGAVVVVEWADRFPDALPADRLEVTIRRPDAAAPQRRVLDAIALGDVAAAALARWQRSLEAGG